MESAQVAPGPSRELSLSNRREKSLLSKDRSGIDRMSVSFGVDHYEGDLASWGEVRDTYRDGELWQTALSGSVPVPGGASVYVGVLARSDGFVRGKAEWNPSRMDDPDGFGLVSLDDALGSAGRVLEAARELVSIPTGSEELRLTRLDVAKDFHSAAVPSGSIIAGLAPIHRPYARRNLVHADPSRNGAQTLMVGSGAGVARLYDKAAETKGRAPSGSLRCEFECRKGWLERFGGLRTVADLEMDGVGAIAENRFEWSAMGAEITTSGALVEVVTKSGLTQREQVGFIGWLVFDQQGHDSGMSSRTLAKYRRVRRELGIGKITDFDSVVFRARLDWPSGEVVTYE